MMPLLCWATGPRFAVELLKPVGLVGALGEVFHLIDEAGAKAAAVGFLQRDHIEVPDQVADAVQVGLTRSGWPEVLPGFEQVIGVMSGLDADPECCS